MVQLEVVEWNAGNGTFEDFKRLLDQCEVFFGCEFGDRGGWLRRAENLGWTVLEGNQPGSASTPVLVRRGIKVRRRITIPVLKPQPIGPGAGPDVNKQKNLVGGLLAKGQVNGPPVIFGALSTHVPPSQQHVKRNRAANKMTKNILKAVDNRYWPYLVAGDWNDTPGGDTPRIMYHAGWTNNHIADEIRPTHGRRAIDYVWWQRRVKGQRLVILERSRTYQNRSDHDAVWCRLTITRRRKG